MGWVSLIFTHTPQSENFPVLPFAEIGFWVSPEDFFDLSPAIDVDPDMYQCSDGCMGDCEVDPLASP